MGRYGKGEGVSSALATIRIKSKRQTSNVPTCVLLAPRRGDGTGRFGAFIINLLFGLEPPRIGQTRLALLLSEKNLFFLCGEDVGVTETPPNFDQKVQSQ